MCRGSTFGFPEVPLSALVGFGSDGAAVMTGRVSGVAARFKRRQPVLTSIHCIAHRLALAAGQARGKILILLNLRFGNCSAFMKTVSVRMNGLKAIEKLLDLPDIKLKKAVDTRLLSHDAACQTLVKGLPAVITSLEREASERGDALAIGLSKVVKQYNFVASLYMMCDVLPKISQLSCIFQFSVIEVSELE